MRKKVLVTGATGFIGSYVINKLLDRHCNIIATSSNRENAIEKGWFTRVNYIELDLKLLDERTNYFEYFEKPDILIHLAWQGLPNYKKEFHLTENLPTHEKFLQNLVDNGLKDITIAGTCLEYGMQEGCLSEEMTCNPTNAYALAKNKLRIAMEGGIDKNNLKLKWVRLFYTYGYGQSQNSLISQLDKALAANNSSFPMSGGEQIRDFLPVEKMAENIVDIALQQNITGIINCCSGIGVSVKDFVLKYLKDHNKEITLELGHYPYNDYEPMRFWGDTSKLKKIK